MIGDYLLEEPDDGDCRRRAGSHKSCQLIEEGLLQADRPVLDHLSKFGYAAIEKLLAVHLRVLNDAPEVEANLITELGKLAPAAEHTQNIELLNAQLDGWRFCDLIKNVLNLCLLQVVLAIVQNLEDLKLIVRLSQVPEHGEELLGQQVLLQEAAEDISRALHELDVCLL